MELNRSGTSIRLANGGFVDAIDASEQYFNQYFSKRDPEFNSTHRDRAASILQKPKPVITTEDSGSMLVSPIGDIVAEPDGSTFTVPGGDDPAFNDA